MPLRPPVSTRFPYTTLFRSRSERQGDLHQRLRRHPARGSAGRGRHRGREEARPEAARRAARGGHQRRAGQEDARRLRPGAHDGRRHGRRREEGGGAREGAEALMAILVDKSTRVVVQGITGKEGAFHAARCKAYGTQVVGGVTPGKGGTTHEGFVVWNTVAEAVAKEGANCALIFVPPPAAADAIMEAAAAGVPLVVC